MFSLSAKSMFPNMNNKQMEKMMKQMGMETEEIPATKVTIETEDSVFEISQPHVSKIRMQGTETFQIQGDVEEKQKETVSAEDVALVMEKANVSEATAKDALAHTDDISEAILSLQHQ